MTEPLGNAPASSFLHSLGARGQRRAEPRTSIALAGAGCALAVVGALAVAGDTGGGDGEFNNVPGIVLSALIVAAGLFTLAAARVGPVATAGAAAAGLGVPPLMFFLTYSESDFPPYSNDGVLMISTLAWLGMYAVGPGRGRPFFLGAGLLGLWASLLQISEKLFDAPFGALAFGIGASQTFSDTGSAIDQPFGGSGDFGSGDFGSSDFGSDFGSSDFGSDFGSGDFGGFGVEAPDPTTLGLISLVLGIAFLLACRWLDKRGNRGTGTPFALATLPTLFFGVAFMADDLQEAGTGLLLIVLGAALAFHGGTTDRRVTAWTGAGAAALGVVVFLGDMTEDTTVLGMLFMAAGIGMVAIAQVVAAALSEPDEMVQTTGAPDPVPVPAAPDAAAAAGDEDWAPPPPGATPPE